VLSTALAVFSSHVTTITAVMHFDLRVIDPALLPRISHATTYMIFDTLLATDANRRWRIGKSAMTI
jgi:hypothetical protein